VERRRAAGLPVGRQPGSTDKAQRKRFGYVAAGKAGMSGAQPTTARHETALPQAMPHDADSRRRLTAPQWLLETFRQGLHEQPLRGRRARDSPLQLDLRHVG